jgi:single stranded DNA-binding protein
MSIKITVEGHLTKAPELRKTTSGKSVTRLDLAHNFRERVGKDFKDVATIFFSASVWEEDGAAEVAELCLTKGSRVSVDGLWSKRTWTHQRRRASRHRRADRQQGPVVHRDRSRSS